MFMLFPKMKIIPFFPYIHYYRTKQYSGKSNIFVGHYPEFFQVINGINNFSFIKVNSVRAIEVNAYML